ncbi:MAG: nucleotidyltransferase family protein [Planctomycetia bacterium]|nr:nucleotidyltransferase family protein [Planctomycetia bacterium]
MPTTTGAILAGGLGTRLRTVVADRPKVLAEVLGKPFLARLLDQLADAGLKRVVLLTGYRSEQVEESFGREYRGMSLDYSVEPAPLGTAGALRLAMPKLFPSTISVGRPASGTVLVMNGDSYCSADLRRFRASHENLPPGHASLVLTEVPDTSRFGKVEFAADDRVERFLEKQEAGGKGWINAGIYLIDRPLVEQIPTGRAVSIEREMFPAWSQRQVLHAFPGAGSFLDIGTPESYRAAEAFFSRRAA